MSNFETHPKKLKDELLTLIHTREMALPDFQRDFVWQPGQTKSLIVSLARGFPAGSLLRMEGKPIFAPRAFATAPELDGHRPKYIVLDGQQRLTSLYQALYGTGEHLYYVDLGMLLKSDDLDSAVSFERREKAQKRLSSRDVQAKKRVLPLAEIFGGDGFHNWLDEIEEVVDQDKPVISKDESKALRNVYETYVEPIVCYEFPVVTLGEDTSLEAVCTIFETLNSTGVRLSVFDLLAARFYAHGENLRDMWTNALEESEYLQRFDIDPYYILQVICSQLKRSIKRSDVLDLDAHEVARVWKDAIWGMEQALRMLFEDCGVLKPDLLSYNTILVPLASTFMKNRSVTGPAVGAMRNKIKQWYWCSVFGQTYESNPTSQTMIDIEQLQRWIAGDRLPDSVSDFKFEKEALFSTTTRQRAVYRGVLCLVLRQSPLDFHSGEKLTADTIASSGIDDHHIFPKAYLDATTKLDARDIDSILNRTLIDRQTNKTIGKNPPSKYLQMIERHLESGKLVLRHHDFDG